jgi:hypothetical protein
MPEAARKLVAANHGELRRLAALPPYDQEWIPVDIEDL